MIKKILQVSLFVLLYITISVFILLTFSGQMYNINLKEINIWTVGIAFGAIVGALSIWLGWGDKIDK